MRLYICSLLGFVLSLSSVAAVSGNSTFSIQKFDNNPIAYVEKIGETRIVDGDWNLLAYYDLKSYFEEFNTVRDSVTQFKSKCIDAGFNCKALVNKFENRLHDIEEKNELLVNDCGEIRAKRQLLAALGLGGLAFGGGALYSWLTKSEGDDYAQAIENLKTNQDQMLEMIKKHTSVIELTRNLTLQSTEQSNKQYANLLDKIDALGRVEKDGWELHNVALQYVIMIESYADTQNRIIDAVMTVRHRNLRSVLISPSRMRKQMEFIQAHLGPEFELPKSVRSVYQLANVKVRLVGDKLIFRLAIPLLRASPFHIWRIIPIPQASNQIFMEIRSTTEYLLVNDKNETYYDLTKLELNACNDIGDQLICKIRHPSYKFGDLTGRCEMALIRNSTSKHTNCQMQPVALEERWTQLDDIHSWIFALASDRSYNVSCNDFTKTITLSGSGLLYLSGNCSFEGDTMQISTHQLETKMTTGYTVSANVSVSFNRTADIHDRPLALVNSTALDAALQDLKNTDSTAKLLQVSIHDWHHYGVIYGFIFGVIILYAVRKLKKSKIEELNINHISV